MVSPKGREWSWASSCIRGVLNRRGFRGFRFYIFLSVLVEPVSSGSLNIPSALLVWYLSAFKFLLVRRVALHLIRAPPFHMDIYRIAHRKYCLNVMTGVELFGQLPGRSDHKIWEMTVVILMFIHAAHYYKCPSLRRVYRRARDSNPLSLLFIDQSHYFDSDMRGGMLQRVIFHER